jgi:preprotein translocase subunit YajC
MILSLPHLLASLHLLAQVNHLAATAPATAPGAGTEPAPFWAQYGQMFPLAIAGVLMWFMFTRSGRGKDKKRASMLKQLKRGDKVVTIGGVMGTVVEARDNDVVLKVDEGSNTKIKFRRDAVKYVVEDETAPAK